jgi:hypothetical protein
VTFPFPTFFPVVLTTLAQVASATSTAQTITGPAGILAGDLLVLWDHASNSTTTIPTAAVPSGFSTVTNDTLVAGVGFGSRNIASIKIATGVEASASLTGMTGTNVIRKALYVFRGDVAITSAMALDAASEYTDGDPASQTVNASGGTPPLVVIGCYRSADVLDPRSFSPAKDGEINPTTTLYLAYKIYNASPQDVTIDMEDEIEGSGLASFYVKCS